MDSWSDLSYDMLEIITKKLRHKELLYFGFVCKSWRFFYLENHCRLPVDLPILHLTQPQSYRAPFLLQSCKSGSDSRKYVCVVDEKVQCEIFLPEAANKWICGSSRGWLVTREIKGYEISLLNPFTRCEIKLPSLTTVPVLLNYVRSLDREQRYCVDLIFKAIISADPISNPEDCVVMALTGNRRRLCFCKLGDSKWTNVKHSLQYLSDVIHYQDRFIATTTRGLVASYDAKNPNAHKIEYLSAPWSNYNKLNTYLVPSGGDLLQIQRIYGVLHPDPHLRIKKRSTVKFEVFKLVKRESRVNNKSTDMGVLSSFYFFIKKYFKREPYEEETKYHWSKLENVHGKLIFVGFNGSFSVPSSVHPNCKGNAIYFSDDYPQIHYSNLRLSDNLLNLNQYPFKYYHHDIGVYDMEESFCSYHESEQFDILPAFWIILHPW